MRKGKYEERTKNLTRSNNYREKYFESNKGYAIPTRPQLTVYFCPYCGKAMFDKKKIAVDHIHSVRRVQYTKKLRERFKALPDGVNDLSNLVACCPSCNRRKGKKGGLWAFRAKYGLYFMPVVRIVFFAGLIMFFIWAATSLM